MTVNVLLITHEEIGSALVHAATKALGTLPLPTTVITVNYDSEPEALIPKLRKLVAAAIANGQGLLVLTDLFGSTPSNIAASLQSNHQIKVITGLNLPMLIRVMNYAHLELPDLAEKAFSGGKDGIIDCSKAEHA